jgi:hypothetical protein
MMHRVDLLTVVAWLAMGWSGVASAQQVADPGIFKVQ